MVLWVEKFWKRSKYGIFVRIWIAIPEGGNLFVYILPQSDINTEFW